MKVISVEDDDDLREILRKHLEKLQCEVADFSNGTDLVRYMKNHPARPDLMILDCRLPDSSGPQIARYVREQFDGPEIPVIFVSAETNLSQIAQEVKNSQYLPKPLRFSDLRSLLAMSALKDEN